MLFSIFYVPYVCWLTPGVYPVLAVAPYAAAKVPERGPSPHLTLLFPHLGPAEILLYTLNYCIFGAHRTIFSTVCMDRNSVYKRPLEETLTRITHRCTTVANTERLELELELYSRAKARASVCLLLVVGGGKRMFLTKDNGGFTHDSTTNMCCEVSGSAETTLRADTKRFYFK